MDAFRFLAWFVFRGSCSKVQSRQDHTIPLCNSSFCSAVHGVLIGWLTKRFSDSVIVRFSCASLLVSYCSLAFCVSLEHLALTLLPLTVSSLTFETINTAQLTKVVSQQHTGSVLAVDMSLSSLSGLVTPIAGTVVLQRYGVKGIGGTCAGMVAVVVLLMYARGVGAGSPDDRKVK